jgi:hypothetical protein
MEPTPPLLIQGKDYVVTADVLRHLDLEMVSFLEC